MRPEILFPLFAPATSLSGVGPRFAKLFETLTGGPAVLDLCWHLPSGLIDRRYAPPLAEAIPGRIATLTVEVGEHRAPPTRRQPYRVQCHDATGTIELVFFHAHRDYLMKALPPGQTRVISGKVEVFNDRLQMTHPDHIAVPAEAESLQTVEPVYPLTAGLTLKTVGKAVHTALQRVPVLPEWLDPPLKAREGWEDWHQALARAHAPQEESDLSPLAPARRRRELLPFTKVATFGGATGATTCLRWSPDSKRLAVGCEDSTVRVYVVQMYDDDDDAAAPEEDEEEAKATPLVFRRHFVFEELKLTARRKISAE